MAGDDRLPRLSVSQSNVGAKPDRHVEGMRPFPFPIPIPHAVPRPAAGKTTTTLLETLMKQGRSRGLSMHLQPQRLEDFRLPLWAGSAFLALRSQMVANLPAGPVVDHVIGEVLAAAEHPVRGTPAWVPTPSMVSADVVLQHGDPSTSVMTAVVAGMRSPAAVRELATNPDPSGEVRSALLFNSVLASMPASVAPSIPVGVTEDPGLAATGLVSAVDAALHGETTRFSLEDWVELPDPSLCLSTVRTTYGPEHRLAGLPLPRDLAEHIRAGGPPLTDSGLETMDPLGQGSVYGALCAEVSRPVGGLAERLGRDAHQGVVGRYLGEQLFAVTGDDPSLWGVAVDLLETWEGSMTEWLETVRALV